MPSFKNLLTAGDAQAIHAFVIQKAHDLYDSLHHSAPQ
jgi:hypothetical protein